MGAVKVYLVRHGETEWSLTGQHTGRTDIALTAHGEDEARALAPTLRALRFDHVLTSPAQRAQRTCALSGLASAAVIEPDLAEWDYGEYEGKRSAEIHHDSPGWSVFHDGCPGGERPGDIVNRADRLIARLRALSGNVAVFSHGHFGCCLAVRWIGLALVEGEHLQLGTASLSVLGFNPSHLDVPVIAQWNFRPNHTA